MEELSAPLSLRLTASLLGVEEPDLKEYMDISKAIAHQMDSGLVPEYREPGNRARKKLNDLVDGWFATEGQPGIVSYIRNNRQNAQVPDHYIRNTTGNMFNASYGTLFATFGNVALTLIEHPDVLERLRDTSLLDTAVDELIRFDGPAQGTSRFATRDTMIGDTVIQRGDCVVTLMAAANRDPVAFPDPDNLTLDRENNQHLGFGWGPHTCVGAVFGRLAVRELLVCLLARTERLQLAGTTTRRATATVRSIGSFPVTFC